MRGGNYANYHDDTLNDGENRIHIFLYFCESARLLASPKELVKTIIQFFWGRAMIPVRAISSIPSGFR